MDREKLQSFIQTAGKDLALIRSSLLIVAQARDAPDLSVPLRNLARLESVTNGNGFSEINELVAECAAALNIHATADKVSPISIYSALDIVARIEAAVWNIPLHSNDFLTDVSGFVDSSFSEFLPQVSEAIDDEEFEIDEETLDIFRSEAEELLANMATGIRVLSTFPADKNALWDIRRNAHTFKGAAGIVGFKDASEAAHLMEDLLDRVVEMQHEA
ncbi:MAG: Hpt domain-containing protein, partial [Pyrinomonadaceae bacterium]